MPFHAHRPLDDAWLFDSDDSDQDAPRDADDDDDSEPDSEPDSLDDMPLPPADFYASEGEMWTAIQAWAAQHKYAFRVGRSNVVNKHRKKLLYQCDRCGPLPVENRPRDDPQRPNHRIRSTSSKKTGCQFSVIGIMVDECYGRFYCSIYYVVVVVGSCPDSLFFMCFIIKNQTIIFQNEFKISMQLESLSEFDAPKSNSITNI